MTSKRETYNPSRIKESTMPTDYTRNTINGSLVFSRMVNGRAVTHTFFGYTVREARAEFSQVCRALKRQAITERKK